MGGWASKWRGDMQEARARERGEGKQSRAMRCARFLLPHNIEYVNIEGYHLYT